MITFFRCNNNAQLFHNVKWFPIYVTRRVQSNSDECLGRRLYVLYLRFSTRIRLCKLRGKEKAAAQRCLQARRKPCDASKCIVHNLVYHLGWPDWGKFIVNFQLHPMFINKIHYINSFVPLYCSKIENKTVNLDSCLITQGNNYFIPKTIKFINPMFYYKYTWPWINYIFILL